MIHYATITLRSGKRVKRKIKDGQIIIRPMEITEIDYITWPYGIKSFPNFHGKSFLEYFKLDIPSEIPQTDF